MAGRKCRGPVTSRRAHRRSLEANNTVIEYPRLGSEIYEGKTTRGVCHSRLASSHRSLYRHSTLLARKIRPLQHLCQDSQGVNRFMIMWIVRVVVPVSTNEAPIAVKSCGKEAMCHYTPVATPYIYPVYHRDH